MSYSAPITFIGRVYGITQQQGIVQQQAGNSTVTKFRMGGQNKFGETTKPCYIDCECWFERPSKFLLEQLPIGSIAIVTGELEMDMWDDQQTGQKRSKHKIRVTDIKFVPRAEAPQQPQQGGAPQGYQQQPQGTQAAPRAPRGAPQGFQQGNQQSRPQRAQQGAYQQPAGPAVGDEDDIPF
jgi:single-strand DNA-binding protein